MPRPRKCRKVSRLPDNTAFFPQRSAPAESTVTITVDEYETLRLIDQVGLSQEECGSYMDIARTTVQQIYTNARRKVAEALVGGFPLRIEGGDYRLAEEEDRQCGNCCRNRQRGDNEEVTK